MKKIVKFAIDGQELPKFYEQNLLFKICLIRNENRTKLDSSEFYLAEFQGVEDDKQ